jgi:hypothetical protein
MPTTGQLILLIAIVLLFLAGGVLSFTRVWWDRRDLRIASRICLGVGIVAAGGLLAWHAASPRNWVPIGDNFDTLVWLATLLAVLPSTSSATARWARWTGSSCRW